MSFSVAKASMPAVKRPVRRRSRTVLMSSAKIRSSSAKVTWRRTKLWACSRMGELRSGRRNSMALQAESSSIARMYSRLSRTLWSLRPLMLPIQTWLPARGRWGYCQLWRESTGFCFPLGGRQWYIAGSRNRYWGPQRSVVCLYIFSSSSSNVAPKSTIKSSW